MLKSRFTILGLIILVVTAAFFFASNASRQPWILFTGLCFGGAFVFDLQRESAKSWVRVLSFCALVFLMQMAVVSESVEEFWRITAGAFLLLSFHYEQNSSAWSGSPIKCGAVLPAIAFLLLAHIQGASFVPAVMSMSCALVALVLLSVYELFICFRHKAEVIVGSYVSSLRMAVAGIASLFYGNVFLPSIFRSSPFDMSIFVLSALGAILAIWALMVRDLRHRHILFTASWSLLILWGVLTGEHERFYASTLACLFGVWSIGMMAVRGVAVKNTAASFLYLSGWCIPGSFLFSAFVFLCYPSETAFIRMTNVVWVFVNILFAVGLVGFDWTENKEKADSSPWQFKAAVVVNLLGICLVAFVSFLPEIGLRYWEGFK